MRRFSPSFIPRQSFLRSGYSHAADCSSRTSRGRKPTPKVSQHSSALDRLPVDAPSHRRCEKRIGSSRGDYDLPARGTPFTTRDIELVSNFVDRPSSLSEHRWINEPGESCRNRPPLPTASRYQPLDLRSPRAVLNTLVESAASLWRPIWLHWPPKGSSMGYDAMVGHSPNTKNPVHAPAGIDRGRMWGERLGKGR